MNVFSVRYWFDVEFSAKFHESIHARQNRRSMTPNGRQHYTCVWLFVMIFYRRKKKQCYRFGYRWRCTAACYCCLLDFIKMQIAHWTSAVSVNSIQHIFNYNCNCVISFLHCNSITIIKRNYIANTWKWAAATQQKTETETPKQWNSFYELAYQHRNRAYCTL